MSRRLLLVLAVVSVLCGPAVADTACDVLGTVVDDDGVPVPGASVSLAGSELAEIERQPAFLRELRNEIEALPGVEAAGATNFLPIGGDLWGMRFAVEGRPQPAPEQLPRASFRVITPGYLEAMGTRVLQGRDFAWEDDTDAPLAVLVNRTLADRYWPDGDAVGRRLHWGAEGPDEPWLAIVGVVELVDDQRAAAPAGQAGDELERLARHVPRRTEVDRAGFQRGVDRLPVGQVGEAR